MAKLLKQLGLIGALLPAIQAQELSVILKNDMSIDSLIIEASELDSILESQLEGYKSEGYWDASIQLDTIARYSEILIATVQPGEIVTIYDIHFEGVSARDDRYLKREFTLGLNAIPADKLAQGEARISGIGYQISKDKRIAIDANNLYHLNYRVKSKPELRAEALASFNQSANADTVAWYGHINIQVPNFDGRGKSFSLQWKRLRANSESFVIGYEHPWIFDLPLMGIFKFGREVIEGNYQIVQTTLGVDWSLDWERSLIFQYENLQSLITHEGLAMNPQWAASRKQLLGLGYRQSNLNLVTHRGVSLRTSLSQAINFEPGSVRRFNFRSEYELNLTSRFYLSQRTQIVVQNQSFDESDPSTLVALGGVNSVRGYDENILRSQSIMSLQHELHFKLGSESQFLALVDLGLYNESNSLQMLNGYGVGFQLRSGSGPLRLILASHRGLNMRNSFLHIEYSGGIPWIDR
ncbi:MAG: BamA/TamA family outer membrane protein [Candidatus Marinimicrobia bacterium]|nr:BamA/TamA family outer membrane protein [Candidatus Neomarinimicrobiota bacterium]